MKTAFTANTATLLLHPYDPKNFVIEKMICSDYLYALGFEGFGLELFWVYCIFWIRFDDDELRHVYKGFLLDLPDILASGVPEQAKLDSTVKVKVSCWLNLIFDEGISIKYLVVTLITTTVLSLLEMGFDRLVSN